MKTVGEKTDKEVLTTGQRFGEFVSVVATLLLCGFFVYHQVANTGFFTAKFGALEMFCLYGPILVSLAAPAVRAVTGRRNPARPLEVATNVFMAIAALWLLEVFPFNFSHLADALPGAIHFVLAWITNDIGKVLLILQIIIGSISAFLTTWKYLSMRRREIAHA
ncbi:MAG TPA: hypothetical protein VNE61_16420 [Ktedonobacteraceae bacterium]|nr:hypothetical protein [Ktedonobacteraceae bacterium]